jgi:pSer/pThr/pTyr-binding forkhead associated (FHA) protein
MRIDLRASCSWNGVGEICVDRSPFVLGRHQDADCWLPLAFVSRQHCQILLRDDIVLIQDLESYNGTFLNGRRILHPTPLSDGDEVNLGPLCLRVRISTTARPPAGRESHTITEELPAWEMTVTHGVESTCPASQILTLGEPLASQ